MADVRNCKDWSEVCSLFTQRAKGYYSGSEKEFYDWLMTKESLGGGKPLFGARTYAYCYMVAKKINSEKANTDHFTVICGAEGSGKSTLAAQIGACVSPTFNSKNILFDPVDFLRAIVIGKPGDTIHVDEGVLFLFSRKTMSKENTTVTQVFQLVRQQRLHIIICIPRFKNLDTEVRTGRADNLIQITERSRYMIITRKGIDFLLKHYPKNVREVKSVRINQEEWYHDRNPAGRFPVINDITWKSYVSDKHDNFIRVIRDAERRLGGGGVVLKVNEGGDISLMTSEGDAVGE